MISKNVLTIYLSVFLFSFSLYACSLDKGSKADREYLINSQLLYPFFEKLYQLEENLEGKINIVHIGDSHIQADFITGTIRDQLQDRFGNGGLGFTFPYNLARTNGSNLVKYTSDAKWKKHSNIKTVLDHNMGLSGISLTTTDKDFTIELNVDSPYRFNTIKVIYPTRKPQFKLSGLDETEDELPTSQEKPIKSILRYHRVQKGESLTALSKKYGIEVNALMRDNGLKNSAIHVGMSLKIMGATFPGAKNQTRAKKMDVDFLPLLFSRYYISYSSDQLMDKIVLHPAESRYERSLNGIVLENREPGVLYHNVGINGAKLLDFNKYPIFFEQLPILSPDLVVISLGTNESFARISPKEYLFELDKFINNIKKNNPTTTILLTTPPPSLWSKNTLNTLVDSYTKELIKLDNYPIWDLFGHMDGLSGITHQGTYVDLISKDKVHYTPMGYEVQGKMFVSDLMKAYVKFKVKKEKL